MLLAAATGAVAVAGCGSGARRSSARAAPPPSPAGFPNTPAGAQARWLFTAVEHAPIPAAAIASHFDTAYLTRVPRPAAAALNQSFVGVKRLRLDAITANTPDTIVFTVTINGTSKAAVKISVDPHGRISTLHLGPIAGTAATPPPPATNPPLHSPRVRQLAIGVGAPPLTATLTLPTGSGPFPGVVLVSGSGPSDQNETIGPNHPFEDIALGLAADGIASLRYDKRTRDYPASINEQTFTLTQEYLPDALAAIRLLQHRKTIDPRLIFVLGHSQGGTYAPLIAKHEPQLAGVILLAAATESPGAAILRQTRYLATLPGAIGANAKAQLPDLEQQVAQINNPAKLSKDQPGTVLLGGVGPAYYLSGYRYHEIATARAIPQPLLLLQGDRDYQVTVANDLETWLKGLKGRKDVTVKQFPKADHAFIDGNGAPTPAEYQKPGHVDPGVIATITTWIKTIDRQHIHRKRSS